MFIPPFGVSDEQGVTVLSKPKEAGSAGQGKSSTSVPPVKRQQLYLIAALAVITVIAVFMVFYNPSQKSTAQKEAAKTPAQPKIRNMAGTSADLGESREVTINTAKGDIVFQVYPKLMPVTVANFEKLVKANFYNGLTFHRVEDWVIQGGDPKGDGTGGPGWTIKLETNTKLKNVRGAVAMARSQDPNSAGSQFYILKKDMSSLDGQYAVFGKVVKGMDVVDKIAIGDKMLTVKE